MEINIEKLKAATTELLKDVGGFAEESWVVIGETKSRSGRKVQIHLKVTCDDWDFIDEPDPAKIAIKLNE